MFFFFVKKISNAETKKENGPGPKNDLKTEINMKRKKGEGKKC